MKKTTSTPAKKSSGNNEKKSSAKSSSTSENPFTKLFVDGLKELYWIENELTKAIPKMIAKTTSEDLIAALEEHLAVTEEQVNKVVQVFETIGKKPEGKKCAAMEGILKEGEEVLKEFDGNTRDAGIILSAQKVEHYEIATYGTLCAFANTLGLSDAADILKEILEEEKEADLKLTEIAESAVNMEAVAEDEEEHEESSK